MVGPLYGLAVGLEADRIALFLSAYVLGGAVAQYPVGWLADKFDRRLVLIWLGVASVAACAVTVAFSGAGLVAVFLAAGFFGFATFPIYSISTAHAHDFADQSERVELSAALMFLYAVGAIASPVIASVLIEWVGPPGMFGFIALAHVLLVVFGLIDGERLDFADGTVPLQILPVVTGVDVIGVSGDGTSATVRISGLGFVEGGGSEYRFGTEVVLDAGTTTGPDVFGRSDAVLGFIANGFVQLTVPLVDGAFGAVNVKTAGGTSASFSLELASIEATALSGTPADAGQASVNAGQSVSINGQGLSTASDILLRYTDVGGSPRMVVLNPTAAAADGTKPPEQVPEPSVQYDGWGTGLPKSSGVYFAWRNGTVQYVGQSINLSSRCVRSHPKLQEGDLLSYVLVAQEQLNFAEAFYIGILKPRRNFGQRYGRRAA
jgi:MFS family permease